MMRGEQVDVGVHGPGGGDRAPRRTTMEVPVLTTTSSAVEGVGVPGPADGVDAPLRGADRHLPDACDGVDHHHVADHDVAGLADGGGLESGHRGRSCRNRRGTRHRGRWASDSTRITSPESPRRSRSPARGSVGGGVGAVRSLVAVLVFGWSRGSCFSPFPDIRRRRPGAGPPSWRPARPGGRPSTRPAKPMPTRVAADRHQPHLRRARRGRADRRGPGGHGRRMP